MCVYRAAEMVCLPFARLLAMAEGLFDRFCFGAQEKNQPITSGLYFIRLSAGLIVQNHL
jgi:hypothetical protein